MSTCILQIYLNISPKHEWYHFHQVVPICSLPARYKQNKYVLRMLCNYGTTVKQETLATGNFSE